MRFFVSAASDDYGKDGQRRKGLRLELTHKLGGESICQENLRWEPGTLIKKLAAHIKICDCVVQLLGKSVGKADTVPESGEVANFLEAHKDEFINRPGKPAFMWKYLMENPHLHEWPQTLMEVYLGFLYGKDVLTLWDVPKMESFSWEAHRSRLDERLQQHYDILVRTATCREAIASDDFNADSLRRDILDLNEREIHRRTIYGGLVISPGVKPHYIPRTDLLWRDDLLSWLKKVKNSPRPAVPKRFFSIIGEGGIGKTHLVAHSLDELGIEVGRQCDFVYTLNFKGGAADGLTFQNIILGISAHVFGRDRFEEFRRLWDFRHTREGMSCLMAEWFKTVNELPFNILIWSDQSEHLLDDQDRLKDGDIGKWLNEWENNNCRNVFIINTTRAGMVRIVNSTHAVRYDLNQGLPHNKAVECLLSSVKELGTQLSPHFAEKLVEHVHAVPGKLEAWVRLFQMCRGKFPEFRVDMDPNKLALDMLSSEERKILMCVDILNQTAVTSTELAEILKIPEFNVDQDLHQLSMWCDPIGDAGSHGVSLHDNLVDSLEDYYSAGDLIAEKRELVKLCATWMKNKIGEWSWTSGEELEPWVQATKMYLRAGIFSDAAWLLHVYDRQVPPGCSALFEHSRANDSIKLRLQLEKSERLSSHHNWTNFLQLGIAHIRIGQYQTSKKYLRKSVKLARRMNRKLEEATALRYLALSLHNSLEPNNLKRKLTLLGSAVEILKGEAEESCELWLCRGNASGLRGELLYTHVLKEKGYEQDRISKLKEAVAGLELAYESSIKGGDSRSRDWWQLLLVKARCAEHHLQRLPVAKFLQEIADIVKDPSKPREPETVLDARLFLVDFHYITNKRESALQLAQESLVYARNSGNPAGFLRAGIRVLLLNPDDVEQPKITRAYTGGRYSLEALLWPLRSTKLGDPFLAICAEDMEILELSLA